MKTSDEIKDIALALSKAQASMMGAKKGSKNPFFKSNYADLAQVIEAISVPFSENDLCFIQAAEMSDQRVSVITRIIHKSGQWFESNTQLPPTKNDAQGVGSAITYAKRYGLQALCGVPSVDDDGNYAVKQATQPKQEPVDILTQIHNCQNKTALIKLHSSLNSQLQKEYGELFTNQKLKLELL